MLYEKFSDEQLASVNQVDLATFLRSQGEALEKSGREWRWKRCSSVTVRDNRWYQHKEVMGGYPIKFLEKFFDMNFVEAVKALLAYQGSNIQTQIKEMKCEKVEFKKPDRNDNNRRAYAYLTKRRWIDSEIVASFIKEGLLYEDRKYHNVIFVGNDEAGSMKHGHWKSTGTGGYIHSANIAGSNAKFSFHYDGRSSEVYVFEAPVDLLSYLTLHKAGWQEHSYIANCGVSSIAMEHYLQEHGNIQKVHLCMDHDIAGDEANKRFKDKLEERGYQVDLKVSQYKDWNEDVKAMHGVEPLPAVRNSKYAVYENVLENLDKRRNVMSSNINFKDLMNTYAKLYYQTSRNEIDRNVIEDLNNMSAQALFLYEEQTKESNSTQRLQNEYRTYQDQGGWNVRFQAIKKSMDTIKCELYIRKNSQSISRNILAEGYLNLAKICSMAVAHLHLVNQEQGMEVELDHKEVVPMDFHQTL